MEQKKPKHTAVFVIISLICLFNPNINIVDCFPDFIAFFMLSRVFRLAADAAPYFDEARSSFIKLGYINLAKLGGIALIGVVRSQNTSDYDIYALLSLVFAILEVIYLIPAISNIFNALSYLGQRSDAKALLGGEGGKSVDSLQTLSYVFFVTKSILYVLPELVRMTGSYDGKESISHLYYPRAVALSVLPAAIIGGIWLFRMIKYTLAVKKEGNFHDALLSVASENSLAEYEKKVYIRSVKTTLSFFVLAAFFSLDLCFSNFNDVNLLPEFIFGILFSLGLIRLARHANAPRYLKISILCTSVLSIGVSVLTYFLSIRFLDNFGYKALIGKRNEQAKSFFDAYKASAFVEMLLLFMLAALSFLLIREFMKKSGMWDGSLKVKSASLSALCAASSLIHFLDIYQNGIVKRVTNTALDYSEVTMVSSSIPWFGVIVTLSYAAYALYSVYYFNSVKEELSEAKLRS